MNTTLTAKAPLVRGCLLALSLLAGFTCRARAQATAGRMVLVPVVIHDDPARLQRLADLIEAGLAARGVTLVSMHDARDRVQARSRAPMAPDNTDLDVLAREARAAIEHVAFGRSAAAQRSVEEVFRRAERALESLNRETKTARNVLDACLALVRSTLHRGERQDALAEAMRCRRMVPDVTPSEFSHPASVIGVLAEADNQLRRMRIGQLTVESTPESGCATYVNGRHLGVTPFRLDRAAEGEYRVQVECGSAPGRVHLVQLGEKPVEVKVDAELDRALHSDARVTLVYDTPAQAQRLSTRHVAEVGRSVRAEEAVLLSVTDDLAELSRVRVDAGTVLGRARLPWLRIEDAESRELVRALDALFEGRVDKLPEPAVAAVTTTADERAPAVARPDDGGRAPTGDQSPRRNAASRKRRLRIAAASLTGVGLSFFWAGVAFEHQRRRAGDELFGLDPRNPAAAGEIAAAQDDYDRGERLRWIGMGAAAPLLAAVPLWRVDVSRGVPWWSYAVGGAGVALAAWGTVELARNGACEASLTTGGCASERDSAGRGALLWVAAAPMLALPLDHVLEWKLGARAERASASIVVSQRGALVAARMELGAW